MAPKTPPDIEDAIIADYKAGHELRVIRARHGVSTRTIRKIRLRRGCALRPGRAGPWGRSGPEHPGFKTGRHYNGQGYMKVWVAPDDPLFQMAPKDGYLLEHRLVMARAIGRPLRREETVHHKNGVRDDNRIENLELRQGQHGAGVRYRCSDCGSHNVEAT